MMDLRRVGIDPDFWYPVAQSRHVKAGKIAPVLWAGERIALVRTERGKLFALEDRCAHRQVPLSSGVVAGEYVRCGYHGWTFEQSGRCIGVPYIGKGETLPAGVRGYPCREDYGLIFIFPGDPAKAKAQLFPDIPSWRDPAYKTRVLDRTIKCHYSFMHENLLDMNHQFLHRSLMGGIRPTLLDLKRGDDWIQAMYTFDRVSGRQSFGEKFMVGHGNGSAQKREHDIMTIRTQYPYQVLQFLRSQEEKPSLDLWLAYVPVDREQRTNHSLGLMMIKKPKIPAIIHIFWPFIVWFTNGIFDQDKDIMEMEQRAHDEQGADWNNEIFPVVQGVREVLRSRGRPLREDQNLPLCSGEGAPVVCENLGELSAEVKDDSRVINPK